jgi:hypothetical protein
VTCVVSASLACLPDFTNYRIGMQLWLRSKTSGPDVFVFFLQEVTDNNGNFDTEAEMSLRADADAMHNHKVAEI